MYGTMVTWMAVAVYMEAVNRPVSDGKGCPPEWTPIQQDWPLYYLPNPRVSLPYGNKSIILHLFYSRKVGASLDSSWCISWIWSWVSIWKTTHCLGCLESVNLLTGVSQDSALYGKSSIWSQHRLACYTIHQPDATGWTELRQKWTSLSELKW